VYPSPELVREGSRLALHAFMRTGEGRLEDMIAGTEAVGREACCVWADPGILSVPALKLAAFNFGTMEF
jgi:hypothetical protein